MKYVLRIVVLSLIVSAVLCLSVMARDNRNMRDQIPTASLAPNLQAVQHDVGNMAITLLNDGSIGLIEYVPSPDVFTGRPLRACEYPKGSMTEYLFSGAPWIGAVVNNTDTLVSLGFEGWTGGMEYFPDGGLPGAIMFRSSLDPSRPGSAGAISHQDYVMRYYDTCTQCSGLGNDAIDNRPHRPLGLTIDQTSYSWAFPYADDFIIIEYTVTNNGRKYCTSCEKTIRDMYIGVYVDADVNSLLNPNIGSQDDIAGIIRTVPVDGCRAVDSLTLAWIADNDGDLLPDTNLKVPDVTGTLVLKSPENLPVHAYNWWVSNANPAKDYGPRKKGTPEDPLRDFTTGGMGTPEGDRNKYYMLRHEEFDFDQAYLNQKSLTDTDWVYPNATYIPDLTDGLDTRYLLSFGPITLDSGQSTTFAIAYVGGVGFHSDPNNLTHLPADPATYYTHLDFRSLYQNALWASWVWDNPGFDTDSDGYAGEYSVCEGETVWYAGDGVPDRRAAANPREPIVTATSQGTEITVRWNGWRSETTADRFTHKIDFEGYNVYLRKTDLAEHFALVGSWDREDYSKYRWDQSAGVWYTDTIVYSLEELTARYGPQGQPDPLWSPRQFTKTHPYRLYGFPDSIFYFASVRCNASAFGLETKIVKQFPDAVQPQYDSPADVPPESTEIYLDDAGQFKYFDYELTISDLLPGQAYTVGVSAFDYGNPIISGSSLESPLATVSTSGPYSVGCCVGTLGNVDCDPVGICDVGDLTALLGHLFGFGGPVCCLDAANIDRSQDGAVDVSDLASMIDYLFIRCESPGACDAAASR